MIVSASQPTDKIGVVRPMLLSGILLLGCGRPAAAIDETPNRVRRDTNLVERAVELWASRRTAIDTLRIQTESVADIVKGTLDDGVPAEDLPVRSTRTWFIDLRNGFLRRETVGGVVGKDGNSTVPAFEALVYDGDRLRSARPDAENNAADTRPWLGLVEHGSAFDMSVVCDNEDLPIFHAIGVMQWSREGLKASLAQQLVASEYKATEAGMTSEMPLTMTYPPSATSNGLFLEYVVDLEKDGAVLSFSKSTPPGTVVFGPRKSRIRTEFQKTAHAWYPSRWICFTGEGDQLVTSTTVEVIDIAVNEPMPASLFGIDEDVLLKPGIVFAKNGKPFTVQADGKTLAPGFGDHHVRHHDTVVRSNDSPAVRFLIGVNIAIVIAVTMVVLRRRSQRRSGQ